MCEHTYTHTHTHTWMHAHVYMYMYSYIYIYIYIYINGKKCRCIKTNICSNIYRQRSLHAQQTQI